MEITKVPIRSLLYRIYRRFIFLSVRSRYINNYKRAKLFNKLHGFKIGHSQICRGSQFEIQGFELGDESFISYNCFFHDAGWSGTVHIGNHVFIAPFVHFECVSHEIGNSVQRAGKTYAKDIIVHDGVWIGANTVILPGVDIGSGSIIAAGSVVLCNIPENQLWAGVPAVFKRNLPV